MAKCECIFVVVCFAPDLVGDWMYLTRKSGKSFTLLGCVLEVEFSFTFGGIIRDPGVAFVKKKLGCFFCCWTAYI